MKQDVVDLSGETQRPYVENILMYLLLGVDFIMARD